MSNGKDTIIRLIVGLVKKTLYKNESILSEAVLEVLEEILTWQSTCQIMQQKMM